MPVELSCAGCSKTLRVPEQHAGKKAKCPKCQTINVVPSASEVPAANAPASFEPVTDNQFNTGGAALATQGITAPATAPNPPAVSTNPYASTQQSFPKVGPSMNKPAAGNFIAFNPLHEAGFFINFTAWFNIIVGFLCCITIFGIIQGGIMVWLGFSLKNANDSMKLAYQSRDPSHLHTASTKLATYFKITGVLTMIGVALLAVYLVIIIVAVIFGLAAGASGNF